jgi:hypothetical protein
VTLTSFAPSFRPASSKTHKLTKARTTSAPLSLRAHNSNQASRTFGPAAGRVIRRLRNRKSSALLWMKACEALSYGLCHQNPYIKKALTQCAKMFSSSKDIAIPVPMRAMHCEQNHIAWTHVSVLTIPVSWPGFCAGWPPTNLGLHVWIFWLCSTSQTMPLFIT